LPTSPVPLPTLRRLPRYHQYLARLHSAGQEQISAAHMAEVLGVHHTQVRKDLSLAGCMGRPKTGHRVDELLAAIETFLHWDNQSEAFLVGVGSLGTALLNYPGFGQAGARIVAAFDLDPAKTGGRVNAIPVLHLDKLPSLAERLHVAVGILTVPADAAQETAELMVASGIRAIWNFAPITLELPRDIIIENLELFTSLACLLRKFAESRQPAPAS
jgi:redox-sensing transcriptional repressor